jgi:protein CpxP
MKKFLLALFLLISGYSYGQQAKSQMMTPEQKANETVTKLKSEISLTDEQAAKVKTITIDRVNKITANHKKYGSDKTRIQAANQVVFEEWEAQLKAIVTPEQYEKYLSTK